MKQMTESIPRKNATNQYKKIIKVIKMLHLTCLNEALKSALDLLDRITNCKVERIMWARH